MTKQTSTPVVRRQKPWLAPLTIPADLRARLEHEWSRMNTAMGLVLPKSHFVRMLLEHGLDDVSQATWAGSEGATVRPSLPEEGLLVEYAKPRHPGVRGARARAKVKARKARNVG